MNSAELGRRIKEARIAKKMTQAELVGDFITRNMLSRIESGNATPSVKTLEYIGGQSLTCRFQALFRKRAISRRIF